MRPWGFAKLTQRRHTRVYRLGARMQARKVPQETACRDLVERRYIHLCPGSHTCDYYSGGSRALPEKGLAGQ